MAKIKKIIIIIQIETWTALMSQTDMHVQI